MSESLPPNAVVRFARGSFDPSRFAEIDALSRKQAEYLVPAITGLPGLVRWYSAVSPEGTILQVSVWESEEASERMSQLTEMTVRARGEMKAAEVTFEPILNYPISWTI